VPPSAGVLSALGLRDRAAVLRPRGQLQARPRPPRSGSRERAARGHGDARAAAPSDRPPRERPVVRRSVDNALPRAACYEVNVPLPSRPLTARDVGRLRESFNALYRRQYVREIRDVAVEAVTFRVRVASRPRATACRGGRVLPPRARLRGHRPCTSARRGPGRVRSTTATRSCRHAARRPRHRGGTRVDHRRLAGARLLVDGHLNLVLGPLALGEALVSRCRAGRHGLRRRSARAGAPTIP
jgi:hypothetical protein